MTEPKKFKRGRHTYTKWGHNFKEVRIEGKPKPPSEPKKPPVSMTFNVDAQMETGVYSNLTLVHRSSTEVVLDFVFLPPGQSRGKVQSRVVVPFNQVKQLATLLGKAVTEIEKGKGE